jgi:hypothetical protein
MNKPFHGTKVPLYGLPFSNYTQEGITKFRFQPQSDILPEARIRRGDQKTTVNAMRRATKNRACWQHKRRGFSMLQKLQNDNDDLLEIFQQH